MTGASSKLKQDPEKKKGKASLVDQHVGIRLRERRLKMGITQNELANKLNITFQQLQKYEKGANRISAGRLHVIAKFLDVSENYFFDGYVDEKVSSTAIQPKFVNYTESKETLNLLKMFYSIEDQSLRENLLKLTKALAKNLKDS